MYISRFDPWGNPLCTCPPKYSLNPYTGCGHRCTYCYITGYIRDAFNPRKKENLLGAVLRELRRLEPGAVVALGNSTDPYQPMEARYGDTRAVLKALVERGFRVIVTTKSPLVLKDLDIIARGRVVVQITITTLRSDVARKLEPNAPDPRARLEAVRKLAEAGVPVTVRYDPIVPGVNEGDYEEVIGAAAEAGARHVVASTFKARRDGLRRVMEAFPEAKPLLEELYLRRGRWFRGYVYRCVVEETRAGGCEGRCC